MRKVAAPALAVVPTGQPPDATLEPDADGTIVTRDAEQNTQ